MSTPLVIVGLTHSVFAEVLAFSSEILTVFVYLFDRSEIILSQLSILEAALKGGIMGFINHIRVRIAERRLHPALLLLTVCVAIALSACQAGEPVVERVEVTRETEGEVTRPVTVPVEVTRIVPQQIVVTRGVPVEVTRVVPQQVEVTREVPVEVTRVVPQRVEVTREVPVEVTRVVEVEVEVTREVPVEVIKEVEVEVIREVPVEVERVVEILVEKEIEVVPEEVTVEWTRVFQDAIDFMKEEGVACRRLSGWALGQMFGMSLSLRHGPIGIPACTRDGRYLGD